MRIHARRGFWLTVASAVLCLATTSSAGNITVTAHRGEMATAAIDSLAIIKEQLERAGFAAKPASVAKALGSSEPLATLSDPGTTPEQLFKEIETGYRLWIRGEFLAAETKLTAVLALIKKNPAVVVSNTAFKPATLKAYVGLAMSRKRLANPAGAAEAMTELIRTMPEAPATKGQFGPEAAEYYNSIRKGLDASPRGKLILDITKPDAQVFINEIGRHKGSIFNADMLPGVYRLMIQVSGESRRYHIDIKPNGESRLSLDWEVSRVVHSNEHGLVISHASVDVAKADSFARRYLLSTHAEIGQVAVIKVEQDTIVMTRLEVVSGKVLKSVSVQLGNGQGEVSDAVRELLRDGKATTTVAKVQGTPANPTAKDPVAINKPVIAEKAQVTSPQVAQAGADDNADAATQPRKDGGASSRRSNGLLAAGLGSTIVGLGSVATGVYLLSIDGEPTCGPNVVTCKDLYDTKSPGTIAVGAGAAVFVVGALLVYKWQQSGKRPAVAVAPAPGGASVVWSMNF